MRSMWSQEISVLIGTRLIVTSPNAMSTRSLASNRSTDGHEHRRGEHNVAPRAPMNPEEQHA